MFMSILICVFTSVYCIIICLVHCYLTVWTCLLHISVCPSVDINGWPNTLQIKFTKHIQSHLDMFLESHVAYPPWPNTNTHHLFFSCHFVICFLKILFMGPDPDIIFKCTFWKWALGLLYIWDVIGLPFKERVEPCAIKY